jgi:hypothetical protein
MKIQAQVIFKRCRFFFLLNLQATLAASGISALVWVCFQGPHRRTPKLRVRPGNRGFAPPHLLYKLEGFGPGSGWGLGVLRCGPSTRILSHLKPRVTQGFSD